MQREKPFTPRPVGSGDRESVPALRPEHAPETGLGSRGAATRVVSPEERVVFRETPSPGAQVVVHLQPRRSRFGLHLGLFVFR